MRNILAGPRPSGELLFSREDLKRLLIPLLMEQALAVTIGMMDTVMVSGCGEASVSGVSLVDSINVLLIMVFSSLATGGSVVVSQFLGTRDRQQAGKAAKQLYYVVLIVSVAIMIPCLALRGPLLSGVFGSIEDEVMEAALVYFLLTAMSYPFLAIYNGSAALLRAVGDSKATLKASIVMNLINVGGNALTIYGFGLGVTGAGLATLVSRIVGAAVVQIPLRRPECAIPYPDFRRVEWDGRLIRMILHIGVPNGLEGGMFQLGKLVLLRMVATFGTVSIAANAVANTVATIQVLPGNAVSLAMITVVGRCVGAHAFDQARYYTRRLMLLAYGLMRALIILMLIGADLVVMPFSLSPETSALAKRLFMLHGWGCVFLWPLSFTLPNALRAAGDTRFTMAVASLSMLVFRVVFGYLLAQAMGLGVFGVWIAMQIDWVCRIACFVLRFRSGKWEKMALV